MIIIFTMDWGKEKGCMLLSLCSESELPKAVSDMKQNHKTPLYTLAMPQLSLTVADFSEDNGESKIVAAQKFLVESLDKAKQAGNAAVFGFEAVE